MNATWNRDNEVSDFPRVVTDFGGHAIFKLGNPSNRRIFAECAGAWQGNFLLGCRLTQPAMLGNSVSKTRSSHNNGCTLIRLFGDLFVVQALYRPIMLTKGFLIIPENLAPLWHTNNGQHGGDST